MRSFLAKTVGNPVKAFVVGNIVMDESYAVDSLPTQGESIFGKKTGTDLGGKGANQAIVLGRSGVPTVLIAATGTDAQADGMIRRLETEPVEARFVKMDGMASDNSIIMTDQIGGNTIITT
ncbi:MAG: PfkB family carbohydrate kinase, partial [Roseobacter sp.]|nr:PfkB family carbohydrate kinase [Roseobacter sp.]